MRSDNALSVHINVKESGKVVQWKKDMKTFEIYIKY